MSIVYCEDGAGAGAALAIALVGDADLVLGFAGIDEVVVGFCTPAGGGGAANLDKSFVTF